MDERNAVAGAELDGSHACRRLRQLALAAAAACRCTPMCPRRIAPQRSTNDASLAVVCVLASAFRLRCAPCVVAVVVCLAFRFFLVAHYPKHLPYNTFGMNDFTHDRYQMMQRSRNLLHHRHRRDVAPV
jgi:hypothetical protein